MGVAVLPMLLLRGATIWQECDFDGRGSTAYATVEGDNHNYDVILVGIAVMPMLLFWGQTLWSCDWCHLPDILWTHHCAASKCRSKIECCQFSSLSSPSPGIDLKIKTIELEGKRIKLQIW